MRGIFYIIALFSLLNADELTEALAKNNNQNSWEHFDYKNTKEAPKIQEENVDFKSTFDSLLSKTLENNNGIDKTDGNLDFQNENVQVKNLSSLYEGENNSLLFQKELFVAQNNYNYSGGLINRYEKDDFLFGVNGFIDKQKEQKDTKSFGTEFGYSKFIKAYSNYYIPNEAEKNLQLGMSFVIPTYTAFAFDISKDNDKTNYQVSYSPYSVFSIVVCAGPSLQKQIPLLKKYQENFVIFCVDGAYPLLVKHDITPDYVLNLDFEEYPLEFFKEVNPENKTLFILAASTHPSVVDYLYKKQIPLSVTLSDNLPYQNLHINDFGYLEFGTHVGHACYTLAIALKFKNIILIGQDLSFDKQGNSHFDSFDLGSDIDTTLNIPTLKTVAYGGLGEVLTHLAWDDYRKKLEDLFARNSQVNFLNATEGGARIEFSKEINFELCCKKFKNLNSKLNKSLPKTLTANRSIKIFNKILETFKEEKQNALFCLEDAMRLNDALKMILTSDRKLPLDFLKNTYESVSNFESFLEINSLLNDGVLKGVIFHKGKLLSEVVISKIEDEKEYLLMYLKSYKQWLEIFIFRLQLKYDIYNFLV
ncbi:motility associated factor glycosyltransferase family protein [Campylobacter jejuni]|uniref:motility associated factor glycosyltransferase family protein n=1 Tax=Campylobacter jejuni TaxID=197 RepID=UPI00111EBB87